MSSFLRLKLSIARGNNIMTVTVHFLFYSSHFAKRFSLQMQRVKAAMKFAMECVIGPLRSACCRESVKSSVCYMWDVYSSAKPLGRHLWTLTTLCLTLAVVTGTLLYHWLSKTLRYDQEASAQAALVVGAAMLTATFLCHPLRCVLTMTLPTVCTKQGRKLIISAAVAILLCNVIPNISVNVSAAVRTLKCTAEDFSKTLLNSSELLNTARQDMLKEAIQVRKEDLSIVTHLRTLDHFTRVDVSEVKSRFTEMIGQVEIHFSYLRSMITHYKLVCNRILAALFVALLILESAIYLKSYLTNIHFDNSKKLCENEAPATAKGFAPLRRRIQICRGERSPSVISLLVVTLYFSAIALIAALDHVVYRTVQVILPLLLEFPAMSASINVTYKVQWFPPAFCIVPQSCIRRQLTDFRKEYKWPFSPPASACSEATASAPSAGLSALLACLWLISYLLLFLDVHATRLQRVICAAFFRKQEERRVAFWNYAKAQPKQERKEPEATPFVVCR